MNLLIYIIWPAWVYTVWCPSFISLNFNIWQFATKHICYSNIYTTYIAIYVTSQQRMVSKLKKNDNKMNRNVPTAWLEGQRKLSQKFGTQNLYTNLQSGRSDCAIKKKGVFFQPLKTRYPLFQVSLSSICKMAYRRVCWNELVHTFCSWDLYTGHWVESRFSARKSNS